MACCALSAFIIYRIFTACEVLSLKTRVETRSLSAYTDSDDGKRKQPSYIQNSQYVSTKFAIEGMTCSPCALAIEDVVTKLNGVQRVSVSLVLNHTTVVYHNAIMSPASIIDAIEKAGYGAEEACYVPTGKRIDLETRKIARLQAIFKRAAVLSIIMAFLDQLSIYLSLSKWQRRDVNISMGLLGAWVQLVDARGIHRNAWIRDRRFAVKWNMDTLISSSLLMGFFLSFLHIYIFGHLKAETCFTSGSFLVTVIIGGRALDQILKGRSIDNLASLQRLQCETDTFKKLPNNSQVPAILLQPQDRIQINPQQIVPCDCYVVDGCSLVDESTMTGESNTVLKQPGDKLMSGTKNLTNAIVVIVSHSKEHSTLQNLIDSIYMATDNQTNPRGLLELATAYFVKLVFGIALLASCVTYGLGHPALNRIDRFGLAAERSMAVLAAACPCALGLAIPSTVIAGLNAALSQGVIVKGGFQTFQNLSKITHMVMDKTGTLTFGRLSVSACMRDNGISSITSQECILLCAAERYNQDQHPVGRAVFKWALSQLNLEERNMQNEATLINLTNIPGMGLSCDVNIPGESVWHSVCVGNAKLLEKHGIMVPEAESVVQCLNWVYFAFDLQYSGKLILEDIIRVEAGKVIEGLERKGIRVTMLTGDTPTEAERVAHALSIKVIASQSLPREKKVVIEKIKSQGDVVAMVGDGLNDVLAQSAADVGITSLISQSASANSGEGSDVVMISESLDSLLQIVQIAEKTVRQAYINIIWVVFYNIFAVAIAAGVAEPWGIRIRAPVAGVLMAFSSLTVLLLSSRLQTQLKRTSN